MRHIQPYRLVRRSSFRCSAIAIGLPLAIAGLAAAPQARANPPEATDWSMLERVESSPASIVRYPPSQPAYGPDAGLPLASYVLRSARRPAQGARRSPAIGIRGPNARADWFHGQRAYPLKDIPAGARLRALEQAERIPELVRAKATATSSWRPVGPLGFDSNVEPTWGRMSGRVRALAIDPANANRLLLGSATGGVWLSTDGGNSWIPLTDTQPSLAIGAVAIAAGNPNVFYAGTGEGNGTYYSAGLLKSVDGGASWTVHGAAEFSRGAISGIAVSPQDSDVVVVCARSGQLLGGGAVGSNVGGIYRSTDGGANFTQTSGNFCTGLAVVAGNASVMYHSATGGGAANGLYRSIDGGVSWLPVGGGIVGGADVERLAIGLSSDGSAIYVGGKVGGDVVIQRSLDSGANWDAALATALPDPIDAADHRLYCESQCDYDNAVAVNPFDAGHVYFGGVGMYRTLDAGVSFQQVGANNTGGGPLHVDHHLVLFDPAAAGVIYNTNDGGIYRSADGGATWTSLGGTLGTMQPYHLSLHPTNPAIMFTGNQDNGTTRRTNNDVWTEVMGGDGGYSAISHANPQIVYGTTTNLNLSKSDNGGTTFAAPVTQVPKDAGEPVAFIAPIAMDPVDADTLYAGTNRLWRSTDGAQTWVPSIALAAAADAYITQIGIAPSNTAIVYTVASDGTVSRGQAGVFVSVTSAPLPGRFATSVVVHPTDPATAYVAYSGFNDATPGAPGHVFKTVNAGATWTDVSGSLPDAPVNAVALRPDQPDEVYAGTDVGVFISLDGGDTWAKMSVGLPNAGVSTLAVNATTNLLAAGTYGRSVWVTDLVAGDAVFRNGFE